MPPKANNKEDNKKSKLHKTCALSCGTKSPGPKYKLKTLVGYNDHDYSRTRNPAYTIGLFRWDKPICRSPGPKYLVKLPSCCCPGYTFPRAVAPKSKECTPGPKYTLPNFSSPAYTIVNKPKSKCPPCTPGPYAAPPVLCKGPSYSFGLKAKSAKCEFNPPIRGVGDITLIKPTIPAFTIVFKPRVKEECRSPGPKYYPKLLKKAPEYTFGMKYSECVTVPRTECDELC